MQRILVVWFCLLPIATIAQINVKYFLDGKLENTLRVADTLEATAWMQSEKLRWFAKGHYFFGLDSSKQSADTTSLYFHLGQSFDFRIGNSSSQSSARKLSRALNSKINYGYPFASLSFDSLRVSEEQIKGVLQIESGPEIRYDSAIFQNPISTRPSYIYQLLDLQPGSSFSEKAYRDIPKKIARSSFLESMQPPDIAFAQNRATVYLQVKEKEANRFRGIFGLQQNTEGRSSVVGSLDLSVQNLFRSGHELNLFWERFAGNSQELDLYYKHAFILGSKVSPSVRFSLLKQDSTFLNRTAAIGLSTFISSKITLLLEYESSTATLLQTEVQQVQGENLADYRRDFYHIGLSKGFFEQLDSFNEGLVWRFAAGLGRKRILENASLPDTFYDSLRLNTDFLRLEARAALQKVVRKRLTYFHELRSGIMENAQLLTNELFRVGGLNTLRGFNEKNFFLNRFALSRLELRSFFENSSYAFLFYDQLLANSSGARGAPFGIGGGFALETSSGQFSFALASGSSQAQQLSFNEIRVHFGFITKF
ncbi:MAG: hypothetical protein AAF616_02095 [Bacteroidota bacterium]